jgi:hypothetical protein
MGLNMRSGSWRVGAAVAVLGVAASLAACAPAPGTGRIAVTGAETFTVEGPAVTCPRPGENSDAYAEIHWTGTVDGEVVTISFAGLRSTTIDVALMDVGGVRYYGMRDGDVRSDPATTPGGPVHLEATVRSDPTQGPEVAAEIVATLRCPQA